MIWLRNVLFNPKLVSCKIVNWQYCVSTHILALATQITQYYTLAVEKNNKSPSFPAGAS